MSITALTLLLAAVGGSEPDSTSFYIPSILLSPIQHVEVAARESGPLSEVLVKEGDLVERNNLLAKIDDAEVQLAFERARIDYEVAKDEANNDIRIRLAKKSLAVAKAEFRRASSAAEKYKRAVPQTELDKLRLTVERDELAVEQSEHELRLAQSNLRLKANAVKLAQLEVAQRRILAPFDGVVAEISRRPSEWVTPGDKVLRILRLDRLRAEGFLEASQAGNELVGRPVTLYFDRPGKPQAEFRGKVVFVSPEVNPVNGQFLIWAEIDNRDLLLRPGLRATMHVGESSRASAE